MIKILMICKLGCQLKSRKLEELAEQIRSDRAKHDAKGKQVESSREGENENTNQDQNQNGDTNNSGGTIGSINQEKVDEMYVFTCKFLHVSYSWLRTES